MDESGRIIKYNLDFGLSDGHFYPSVINDTTTKKDVRVTTNIEKTFIAEEMRCSEKHILKLASKYENAFDSFGDKFKSTDIVAVKVACQLDEAEYVLCYHSASESDTISISRVTTPDEEFRDNLLITVNMKGPSTCKPI